MEVTLQYTSATENVLPSWFLAAGSTRTQAPQAGTWEALFSERLWDSLSARLLNDVRATAATEAEVPLRPSRTGVICLDLYVAPPATSAVVPDEVTMPSSEQALLVCSSLGLNKSDLARVFGVSRPALYAWINGDSEPQGLNAQRLSTLAGLARDVCRDTRRPLFHRFVNDPLPGESASVLELLQQATWDEPRLRGLLREARRLTTERDARIARATPAAVTAPTPEAQAHILSDNLTALGAEG